MAICKGCCKEKTLIRAHIVPAAFFPTCEQESTAPKIISTNPGQYPRRIPNGIYDPEILCRKCEDDFENLDEYAIKILLQSKNQQFPLKDHRGIAGYRIDNVDYLLIKRFFISVLYRASLSTRPEFSKVTLGSLEHKARDIFKGARNPEPDDFSFVISKFEKSKTSIGFMDPHPERWNKVRYYRIYLGEYVVLVKADSQKTPSLWSPFIIEHNQLIIISRGQFEDSPEMRLLIKAVTETKRTLEKRQKTKT